MIFKQCNLLYTSKGKYEKNIVSLRCGHVNQLVKRMIDHANAISLEVNISALAIAEAKGKIKNNEVDVVLLGPQVRFQKPEIEAVAQGKMPVAVIEMKDYGTMNGQAVLEFAMKLLQE